MLTIPASAKAATRSYRTKSQPAAAWMDILTGRYLTVWVISDLRVDMRLALTPDSNREECCVRVIDLSNWNDYLRHLAQL